MDFSDYENRVVFIAKVDTFFENLYESLKNLPNGDTKKIIIDEIQESQERIHDCFDDFNHDSFENAKDIIKKVESNLPNKLAEITTNDKSDVEVYNTKLKNYKEAVKRHKDLEKDYKNGKIKYDMYFGSYNALIELYNDLIDDYENIADNTLEKPQDFVVIPKSIDDLLIKDMQAEIDDYDRYLAHYEDEVYPDYVVAQEKYDKGKISKEDYLIEVTKCSDTENVLTTEKARLEKMKDDYQKTFDAPPGEYNHATEEELISYYEELEEYNTLIVDYEKELTLFEELEEKLKNGLIAQSEYDIQRNVKDNKYNELINRQKKLKTKQKKIYSSTSLSILNRRKVNLQDMINNPNLSENEKEELLKKLNETIEKIKEINAFKSKLVIKQIKKTTKKIQRKSPTSKPKKPTIGDIKGHTPAMYFDPNDKNEEPEHKVVKKTVWQWVKDHKKQILIALGLTALAITTVVLVTQLLPAIVAAQQASQTAGLLSQMLANGSAWHTAIASEQVALHGANTALASQISALTGASHVYNAATGVWTIGGKSLAAAATSYSALAAKTAATVGTLNGATVGTSLAGIGLLGTGLLLRDKSDRYKEILSEIKELKFEDIINIEVIKAISNKIDAANINNTEKIVLNKKLKHRIKALKRKAKKKGLIKEKDLFHMLEDSDNSKHQAPNPVENEDGKGR